MTSLNSHSTLNGDILSCNNNFNNSSENVVTVVLGAQWGDEGKGKVVDMLAMSADVVCRCQVL